MIGLESLDTTYYSTKNGGCINNAIIKNMEEMALDKNNVHFSHLKYPKLGGMSTLWRTGHTLGSTFAALCGAPFMGKNKPNGMTEGYLNNLTCLGELLNEANYITSATYGCPPFDWGYGHVFDYHHYQRINVVGEILKNQTNNFWIDDYLTYGIFKTELNFLPKQGKPFFAYMSTIDTHEPGFSCYLCPKEDNKMLQAAKCADNQLKNFLSWAKNQQWYNNTVFMIFGDHVTREIGIKEIAKAQNYKRASYDLIINSELKSNNTYERLFTSFDLMPTVLAAAGVKIKGDRLGQGVNLFSDIPTHYETYGTKFDNSFDDVNKWYETVIMHKPTACDDSNPCIFMQSLILDTKYSNLNISN